MNCQRRILGIRGFHFVTNASVTSQTDEERLAIRICRRRLSIFGHVRRLPEATPAHSALRLAVDTRAGGKPDIRRSGSARVDDPTERGCSRSRTTLGSTQTTPGGPQVLEGATNSLVRTRGAHFKHKLTLALRYISASVLLTFKFFFQFFCMTTARTSQR